MGKFEELIKQEIKETKNKLSEKDHVLSEVEKASLAFYYIKLEKLKEA